MSSTTTRGDDIAPASLAAWERCKLTVGGGVSSGLRASMQPHPLFVDRAEGARVWDLDGREYVDYVGAWGPSVLGHGHPHVLAAVQEVLPRMQMVGMGHVLEYEAAEAVVGAVPGAEKLLWSNTGTEAVQVALRLARASTGRMRFVKFVGGYHGWHDSVFASVAFHQPGDRGTYHSLGQHPRVLEDMTVLPFNDVDAITTTLSRAAELDLAAVLIDPILSSGGLEAPDPAFLDALRPGCQASGVVLIFDEVVSGFRVALGGATERWGVIPDLWTVGKAVAGGFSQSAVLGRADLIDQVDAGVFHAGTYNGNPVALAAVKASVEAMSEPGFYDRLEETSSRLLDAIGAVLTDASAPATTHRIGSVLSIHSDGTDPGWWDRLSAELLREGVVVLPGGKLFVSGAHDDTVVSRTIDAFTKAVPAARGAA